MAGEQHHHVISDNGRIRSLVDSTLATGKVPKVGVLEMGVVLQAVAQRPVHADVRQPEQGETRGCGGAQPVR